MSGQTLEFLLKDCTVKVLTSNQSSVGTAFFVAPRLLLTCAHVVERYQKNLIQVFWAKSNHTYEVRIVWLSPESKKIDVALLEIQGKLPYHPCVALDIAMQEGDEDLRVNDDLFSFGYMRDYRSGAGVVGKSESLTGDSPPLIKFQGGKIQRGLSGAPLLNLKTGKVCGIVKETRSTSFPQGGG
ncbi:MAG: serine protease, partial [Cyanobacteria bacterium J06649_4]